MKKLISFDLESQMGFFKKPDINDGIYLTYNMIHKPALLGILGAIIGLEGYKENGKLPQYYLELQNLQIGIEPLNHDKGNFTKTIVKYCNGVGYASQEVGGNLIIVEQTLIKPSYRVYLLLNLEISNELKLYTYIKECKAEYLPYLGKNDHSVWWTKESVKEYEFRRFENENDFKISSIFRKENSVKEERVKPKIKFRNRDISDYQQFVFFERLPISFHSKLFQYELAEFAFTNWTIAQDSTIENLFELSSRNETIIIQLIQ